MTNRFHGEITFPRSALVHEQLRTHITRDFRIEPDDFDFNECIHVDDCGVDLSTPDFVTVYDQEARNGYLEPTEAVLIALGVPFDGRCEAKHEYDAEFRWWRPGMDKIQSLTSNVDGNVTTTVEQIIAALSDVAGTDDAEVVRRRVREALPDTRYLDDPLSRYAQQAA